MKSKTIWFFNDYAGSKYHGMEFRNYYIACELVKKGHKVYIVSASYMHLFKKLPEVEGEYTFENIDGIDYIWIKVPHYRASNDKKRILKWFVFVKKLYKLPIDKMDAPDFIIASPMAPFLIKPAHYFAKKLNAKLVYEIKDIWPLSLIELGGYSKYHPLIWLMQRFANYAYKKADITITVLANGFEYMQQYGLTKDKFKYIPNGISLDDMLEGRKLNLATKEKLQNNKFKIGYAGTLGTANALEDFVSSAKYLLAYDNIQLVLVGDGKNKKILQEITREHHLTNVSFIDPVPKNEVQSLLTEFDICFLGWHDKKVYNYGVSPNKLFDYMYSGKPILHAFSGKGDLVQMANCGVSVAAKDPKAISEGILELYKLPEKARTIYGENGKRYALENHTYKNIAQEFLQTLEKIQ